MLNLGSTYLIVRDMDTSIDFYEALLEMKVTAKNEDRWAQFNFGYACIALWNPKYDKEKIREGKDLSSSYNPAYLEYKANHSITYGNNVVLNFWVDDLNQEYERIRERKIGRVSEILYINVASPYYCFMLDDPDGNPIEITGKWSSSSE